MKRAAILVLTVFLPAVAAAQQPCTTDARQVVNELYRHMLERQADAGSAHWVQQLESGRMTVRGVVRAIAASPDTHSGSCIRRTARTRRTSALSPGCTGTFLDDSLTSRVSAHLHE